MQLLNIELSRVIADEEFNCRGKISPISVADLARDIQEKGLIQPVTVAPFGEAYKLIAGFRRHMAHKILKAKTILAVVREDMEDEKRARSFNLTENLHRSDLTIMEEANALRKLAALGMTRDAIAHEVGKSTAWVTTRIQLMGLPPEIQDEVVAGSFTSKDIRDLYNIYSKVGNDEAFKAVRDIKDAKLRGKEIKTKEIKDKTKPKNVRKARQPNEIGRLMAVLQEHIGNGLHTRVLAWCAGIVDDFEIHNDIAEKVEAAGGTYTIPEFK